MADAQILYAEKVTATGTTTTADNWQDVCSIAAASFTAGAVYLIIANTFLRHGSSSQELKMRVVHGTTPTEFTDGQSRYELTATNQKTNASYACVYTQPGTAELIKIQVATSGTTQGFCDMGQIIAINLDNVGTLNTDYFYNEDLVNYTTTGSKVSKASVTFTPNGTDDWLVIANAQIVPGSITDNHLMDLNDSVAGVLVNYTAEGEDTVNEIRSPLLMNVVTPTNASHTFSARFSHQTTASTVNRNFIFAINLNKFAQHSFSSAAAQDAPAASPTWTTTRTISPTPSATGSWFYWGYLSNDANVLTDDLAVRLQANPSGGGLASNPNYGDTATKQDSWDATDILPVNIFYFQSLTSGAARDINLDAQMIAGTTLRVQERTLVAFSAALPAAGGWTNIAKINGITSASIGKINGIAVASISKVNGVSV